MFVNEIEKAIFGGVFNPWQLPIIKSVLSIFALTNKRSCEQKRNYWTCGRNP